jgi:hypothetical protein
MILNNQRLQGCKSEHEALLQEHIERMVQLQRSIIDGKVKFCGIEELILALGQFDTVQALPAGISRGRMKRCFQNAYHLMLEGYVYVEGIAMTATCLFPTFHAWCVDENGGVIDPTWPDGVAYLGVHLRREFVLERVMKKGRYGVFGNIEARDLYEYGLPKGVLT